MQQSASPKKVETPEETLLLSGRDAKTVLNALDNPPPPADNLVQALKAHSTLVKC